MCGSILGNPISIWIEESFETIDSSEPVILGSIFSESITRYAQEFSGFCYILVSEIGIDVIHVPPWEYRDSDICMDRLR